jgi:hypothetical protein
MCYNLVVHMFDVQQQTQLNQLIQQLQQRYGSRGGRRADQLAQLPSAVISSGFPVLDAVLPGGGIPRGALTYIRGPAGSGATSLALLLLARLQSTGGLVGAADLSSTLAPTAFAAAGLALDELVLIRPCDGTTAALTLLTLLMRQLPTAYLIDSPAHWQTYPDAARSLALVRQRLPRLLRSSGTALLVRAAAPPLPLPTAETLPFWAELAAVEIAVQPQHWLRRYGVIVGCRVTAQVRAAQRRYQIPLLDLPLLELDELQLSAGEAEAACSGHYG